MAATLSPSPFRVALSQTQENLTCSSCLLFSRSHFRRPVLARSLKLSVTEQFGEPKKVLDNLAVNLQSIYPEPLKQFPWEKAKAAALERILFLGKNAFKWSFMTWFIVSFVIDISVTVLRNRELLIPIGLFIGVTLADFLKETSQELFKNNIKDMSYIKNLLGIGSLFVLIKLISFGMNMQWHGLLSHIGNGGLMQVLWLAKELQQPENLESQDTMNVDSTTCKSKE